MTRNQENALQLKFMIKNVGPYTFWSLCTKDRMREGDNFNHTKKSEDIKLN